MRLERIGANMNMNGVASTIKFSLSPPNTSPRAGGREGKTFPESAEITKFILFMTRKHL